MELFILGKSNRCRNVKNQVFVHIDLTFDDDVINIVSLHHSLRIEIGHIRKCFEPPTTLIPVVPEAPCSMLQPPPTDHKSQLHIVEYPLSWNVILNVWLLLLFSTFPPEKPTKERERTLPNSLSFSYSLLSFLFNCLLLLFFSLLELNLNWAKSLLETLSLFGAHSE